ncbi:MULTISPECIES: hypothetical protein [unclassified Streptomyces]|uniref:hypothetical protein n=1 Tax=unclassified Streptomyces TaxID=2593676 RepID=UPI00344D95C7
MSIPELSADFLAQGTQLIDGIRAGTQQALQQPLPPSLQLLTGALRVGGVAQLGGARLQL